MTLYLVLGLWAGLPRALKTIARLLWIDSLLAISVANGFRFRKISHAYRAESHRSPAFRIQDSMSVKKYLPLQTSYVYWKWRKIWLLFPDQGWVWYWKSCSDTFCEYPFIEHHDESVTWGCNFNLRNHAESISEWLSGTSNTTFPVIETAI